LEYRLKQTVPIVSAKMQLQLVNGVILFCKRFQVARRCVRGQICEDLRAARPAIVRKGNNTDEDAQQGRGADNYSLDARAMGKTHRNCCIEFCLMIRATKASSLSAGAMSASSSIGVSPSASASSAIIIARRDAIESQSDLLALNVSRRTCANDQFDKHQNWDAVMHQSDNGVFARFAEPPESLPLSSNLAESCEHPEKKCTR
jgi:hypothetical protein